MVTPVLATTLGFFQVEVVSPVREQSVELHTGIERLAAYAPSRSLTEERQGPAKQLQAFYLHFPENRTGEGGDALTDALERIHEAAREEIVILDHGEYQMAREEGGELLRYDMTLPISGPYPRLRRFLKKVLEDNTNLALSDISFTRQAAGDIGVDAQVHMTLYLRVGRT